MSTVDFDRRAKGDGIPCHLLRPHKLIVARASNEIQVAVPVKVSRDHGTRPSKGQKLLAAREHAATLILVQVDGPVVRSGCQDVHVSVVVKVENVYRFAEVGRVVNDVRGAKGARTRAQHVGDRILGRNTVQNVGERIPVQVTDGNGADGTNGADEFLLASERGSVQVLEQAER